MWLLTLYRRCEGSDLFQSAAIIKLDAIIQALLSIHRLYIESLNTLNYMLMSNRKAKLTSDTYMCNVVLKEREFHESILNAIIETNDNINMSSCHHVQWV